MKPLLAYDSPLYLKRLARELNQQEHGFYFNGIRGTVARVSQGNLQLWEAGPSARNPSPIFGQWQDVQLPSDGKHSFVDAYGREIVARRSV